VPRDFGSSARRSRNSNERERRRAQSFTAPNNFDVVQNIPSLGSHRGDGLGGIKGAPTTETDDHVSAALFCQGDSRPDSVQCGLAGDLKTGDIKRLVIQMAHELVGPVGISSSHHEDSLAEPRSELANLCEPAASENDP